MIYAKDNTSPGGVGRGAPGGKLVPGSHKRCELGHTVIRHCSREDQRIREVVPDSMWKETTFVRFFAKKPKSVDFYNDYSSG